MSTFLYEVRPLIKPVKTPDGRATRAPFSAMLTINQIKEYMKVASVYRKFPDNTTPIKVTGGTLEELHREKFKKELVTTPACTGLNKEDECGSLNEEEIVEPIEEEVESVEEDESIFEEETEDIPSEEDEEENVSEEIGEEVVEEESVEAPVANNTAPVSRNVQFTNSVNNNKKNKHYHNNKK